MSILIAILAELLKACLPELLNFAAEKLSEPNTMQIAVRDGDLDRAVAGNVRVSIANGDVPPPGFDGHAQS
jgi:hypothetical protein